MFGIVEDAVLVDDAAMTEELVAAALLFQETTGALKDVRVRRTTVREYPKEPVASGSCRQRKKRNAPCPCGSGKKWKKCCGAPRF